MGGDSLAEGGATATPRKPVPATTAAIEAFCTQFDDLFCRRAECAALRRYRIGMVLPREHHKTMTVLPSLVPGAERQRLRRFLRDAPWDAEAPNRRRLAAWLADRELAPQAGGVLVVDETGDRRARPRHRARGEPVDR
jgi:SRSO17 transposase